MVIRKRPIISWLLGHEDENKLEIPMTNNRIHFKYLFKGREFLSDVRNTKPDWGLPELIMPSFEKSWRKVQSHLLISNINFSKNFIMIMYAVSLLKRKQL